MSVVLNEEQKKAVEHKSGPLLIIAGAGTGKTSVITQRILHILEKMSFFCLILFLKDC